MSGKQKGQRIIREKCIPHYENQGFVVGKVERTGRFIKNKDLFGALLDGDYTDTGFDLIALKKNLVVLIQATCNSPKTQKWFRDFAKKYASDSLQVHVYTWYDNQGPRIQNYLEKGILKETDLRKWKNDGKKLYDY